jgi:hypothetical protein
MTSVAAGRVSPFGHPEITACVQLPQAYRSLPRPSSPLDAKASTVCLIAFDLKSLCYMIRFGFPVTPHACAVSPHPAFSCQRARINVSYGGAVRATSEKLSAAG